MHTSFKIPARMKPIGELYLINSAIVMFSRNATQQLASSTGHHVTISFQCGVFSISSGWTTTKKKNMPPKKRKHNGITNKT
mmetsp:Transcript_24524/g.46530  ORF Transcript_24524/g.46530 Transcript_24524/m.46530 type:complete len:81 (-) Transcript_24524:765-1007(-)